MTGLTRRPVVVLASVALPLDPKPTVKRASTNPYGFQAVGTSALPSWAGIKSLDLSGYFESDARPPSLDAVARARARALPESLFLSPRASAPPVRTAPASRSLEPPGEVLPSVGSVLGDRYRLEELLGVGGFAAVYRAQHLLLKREVALKLLLPSIARRRPDLVTSLPREAELAARLDHPNVVRMLDVFRTVDSTFLVMEYVEGRSLGALLRRRPLPAKKVVEIGIDIARGLQAGLARGLIHRDIKPANIMITHEGHAKIVDFGLALGASDPASASRHIVGTRGYAAPEQVLDPARVDFRADIFGLGATLYHAALGAAPFAGSSSESGLAAQRSWDFEPPERVSPSFPAPLAQLLSWLLSRDSASRPGSYDLVIDALESVRNKLGYRTEK